MLILEISLSGFSLGCNNECAADYAIYISENHLFRFETVIR